MGLITPTLPTSGQDRGPEEVDVINTLQTMVSVINGNIDGANLAAAVFAPYRRAFQGIGTLANAAGTGVRVFDVAGTNYANGGTITSGNFNGFVMVSPNPYALSGKTSKLRLFAHVACNNVAPGGGSCTFTLRPVTIGGTGGSVTLTGGTSIASVAVTPVQAGQASNASSDVDLPTSSGLYIVAAQMSVAVAANAVLTLNYGVSIHHV